MVDVRMPTSVLHLALPENFVEQFCLMQRNRRDRYSVADIADPCLGRHYR